MPDSCADMDGPRRRGNVFDEPRWARNRRNHAEQVMDLDASSVLSLERRNQSTIHTFWVCIITSRVRYIVRSLHVALRRSVGIASASRCVENHLVRD